MNNDQAQQIQKLKEHILCLEAVIHNMSEGVLVTDRECRVTVYNPAKATMERMESKNIIGAISWEAYTHSNEEISEHKKVFDTAKPIINAYRPHAYVDDIPVYIYYSTYPVVQDGAVIGVYTISRNETVLRNLLYDTIEHKRQTHLESVKDSETPFLAPGTRFSFNNMVGQSKAMRSLIKDAQNIASIPTSIMISGETGTGKEVLAQSIHNFGKEGKKFLPINCAAIPEELVESILFGSVKGAYTGATDKIGLFQEAKDGTVFLDEINSISLATQAKLLRALQERCVRPVGSLKEYPIQCRLICASNEAPHVLLAEKRLRQDFFYRLSGFHLHIPALRERPEDIIDLAAMFIRNYNDTFQKNIKSMSEELIERLKSYHWPGNVRELQHVIQNMMLKVHDLDTVLGDEHYPLYIVPAPLLHEGVEPLQENDLDQPQGMPQTYYETCNLSATLEDIQRNIIRYRLQRNKGNLSKTARELGLHRQNLAERVRRLGFEAK